MAAKRPRGSTRWTRSWMYEQGVRLYAGDPHCVLAVVGWGGKPGRRWLLLPTHPPLGVDHWELLEWGADMVLRKDQAPKATDSAAVTLVDVKAQKQWPTLWTYLTQAKWEDDTPRATSGLTVFVQDGLFKVLLKENEAHLCLWAAGSSFYGALDAIEAALAMPEPDWRVDRRAGGGLAKKGRK